MNKKQLLQNTRDELSATKILLREMKNDRNLFISLTIFFLLCLAYTYINEVSVREDLSTCQERLGNYKGDELNITQTIEKIAKDCGETFITTYNNELSVFKSVCIEGNYCKYAYVPLRECLK